MAIGIRKYNLLALSPQTYRNILRLLELLIRLK